jgi:ATP-dependent DNA ligase
MASKPPMPAGRNFDAIIFGYYDGDGQLTYVARTRNGFTPASRDELFGRFRGLKIERCPFVNLPEARSRRRGQGLTAEKMADCRWLKPLNAHSALNEDWLVRYGAGPSFRTVGLGGKVALSF